VENVILCVIVSCNSCILLELFFVPTTRLAADRRAQSLAPPLSSNLVHMCLACLRVFYLCVSISVLYILKFTQYLVIEHKS